MAAFSLGQPGDSGRPSRHKGAEAGLHECGVSIRWLALGANSSLEHVQQGGVAVCQACIRGITHPNAYLSASFMSAELDFLDSVPSSGSGKTQNSSSERMLPLALVWLHIF